ncbi:hypothetical protein ACFFV7_07880 [Nonomuraea spiralis]|uniref:Uncharacterized protein n=1 Tax=Nonomuraea spiralis TaxID=46182 RepID=A0ABV5I989_9ACTN|nr:hypothetical protein [Nonomuraea spiralis]GGS76936.1 hypothetical protein GCM10010176_020120 [Nonomuraea spiralis]
MRKGEWEEWLASLPRESQTGAQRMLDKLIAAGAAGDLHGVVMSDLEGGAPEFARFILLRRIWIDLIREWGQNDSLVRLRTVERLVDQGAELDDISRLAQAIAYETAFGILYLLDLGQDSEMGDTSGWRLVETDSNGNATGRSINGLHESLLGVDPTEAEGMDFLD